MKWILFLLVSTVTWAGGWETSRFFVQINGGDVGTFTISRSAEADTITTRTESTLEIIRGGQKLAMSESTESVSRVDGTPVSLSYEMDQGGMRLAFTATFDRDSIRIKGEDGKETPLKRPDNLLLDNGMARLLTKMIRSGEGETVVSSLFPAARSTIPRTVTYQGTMETEHGTFHRFRIADQVGAMELVQDTLVDEAGHMVHAVSHVMGMEIRYVPEAWHTDTGDTQAPDFLIQTLFAADRYFPSGFDVHSFTCRLTGLQPGSLVPNGDFQTVTPVSGGFRITITRPQRPTDTTPVNDPEALKDGPVVQTSLDEIRSIAERLMKDHPDPFSRAKAGIMESHDRIRLKGYGVGFADTATILKDGAGDCTEHTVLAMAILRASGIPCRAAAGLVSLNGIMGYHMWVEVGLGSRWIPMDPTFHQPLADPSHIRLIHSLLNDTGFQGDLMPILAMISRVKLSPEQVALMDGRTLTGDTFHGTGILPIPYWQISTGESFTWKPGSPTPEQDRYEAGTACFEQGGMIMTVSMADVKERSDADQLVARLGIPFSPLSFEMIGESRVAFGWDGSRLAMFTVRDGTVLQFTFADPSATIGEQLKEQAYDICLKILSHGKRTDPDR